VTLERAAAIKQMEAAIEAFRATAVDDREAELLTGWAVVCAFTSYDAEGGKTSVSVYQPDTQALWQELGLLKAGTMMVEADFLDVPVDPS
jgi:hypothetical protein